MEIGVEHRARKIGNIAQRAHLLFALAYRHLHRSATCLFPQRRFWTRHTVVTACLQVGSVYIYVSALVARAARRIFFGYGTVTFGMEFLSHAAYAHLLTITCLYAPPLHYHLTFLLQACVLPVFPHYRTDAACYTTHTSSTGTAVRTRAHAAGWQVIRRAFTYACCGAAARCTARFPALSHPHSLPTHWHTCLARRHPYPEHAATALSWQLTTAFWTRLPFLCCRPAHHYVLPHMPYTLFSPSPHHHLAPLPYSNSLFLSIPYIFCISSSFCPPHIPTKHEKKRNEEI